MITPDISLKPSEASVQSSCVQWFWNQMPEHRGKFFAITNNSQNSFAGARNKAMGVVSGVSDTCLICSGGRVVWIEFKNSIGRHSGDQVKWFNTVVYAGHTYLTCRSLEQFKQIVNKYLL